MRLRWLIIAFWMLAYTGLAQDCPDLTGPVDGATNVPVESTISWDAVPGINGYIISLGTTPGGDDIISSQAVGLSTSLTPATGLPEATRVFVTIELFIINLPNIVCPSQSFTTENVTVPPDCTEMTAPTDGAVDVIVGTNISWRYAPKATGYRITIGTAPGAGDIVSNLDVGNVLLYDPPADFPPNTTIYVLIVPYNENGSAIGCIEESFTTRDLGDPPGCTRMISPADGELSVGLTPLLEWEAVPDALGYIVNIGTTPTNRDVLDRGIFFTNSTFVINFQAGTTYFIQIIPFNDAGEAQGCITESFSTVLGCGPFIDPVTGELVTLNPEINFPDRVGICANEIPTQVTTSDSADGYRWYKITDNGVQVLIMEGPTVDILEEGRYVYEAYVYADPVTRQIECPSFQEFTVTSSEVARIDRIAIQETGQTFTVTIEVSGSGDYEFALNDSSGPYQDENVFEDLEPGTYIVYVRDKNGCGITQESFFLELPRTGFPPYFSPNGDGINDFWQYRPPEVDPLPLTTIFVFDRYGKLLHQFSPNGQGWDGRYLDRPLPASGYWYKAETSDNRIFTGFFSLVR